MERPPVDAPSDIDSLLFAALVRASKAPILLVVSDFDGVLADFVDDPSAARPTPECMTALGALAECANTNVAIVSGRGRDALAEVADSPASIELIGSHGAEWREGFANPLNDIDRGRLRQIVDDLEQIAAQHGGTFVERKDASAALHYRTANSADTAERARQLALDGPGSQSFAFVTAGKNVVEIAVVDTSKGTAISTLRQKTGADVVVFVGDDVTDEKGFTSMTASDVSVKVGSGDTAANYRIAGFDQVRTVYSLLAALRISP